MPKFEVRFTCEVRKIKTMIVEAESEGMLNSNFPLLSEEAYKSADGWVEGEPDEKDWDILKRVLEPDADYRLVSPKLVSMKEEE